MGRAVADEPMGLAEVERNIRRIDGELEKKVSQEVWKTEKEHIHDRLDDIETGKQNAWGRSLQIAAIVGGLMAAWLGAYIASKGIK